MSVIYLLISISIVVAIIFLLLLFRAVKTGQYDDDYTPSVRMLFDDELKRKSKISNTNRRKTNLIMEMQQFYYDNKIVKKFLCHYSFWCSRNVSWAHFSLHVSFPNITDGISWLSFGRLRPLHTNAVIFAFVGNRCLQEFIILLQRLLKARMLVIF
jgi:cbb3-type cytochrome oxidase maturation protein